MMNIDINELSPAQLKALVEAGLINVGGTSVAPTETGKRRTRSDSDENLAKNYFDAKFSTYHLAVKEKNPITRLILCDKLWSEVKQDIRRLAGYDGVDSKGKPKYNPAKHPIGLRHKDHLPTDWADDDTRGKIEGKRVKLSNGIRSFGQSGPNSYPLLAKLVLGEATDEDRQIVINAPNNIRDAIVALLAGEAHDDGSLLYAQKGSRGDDRYAFDPMTNKEGVRKRMHESIGGTKAKSEQAPEGVDSASIMAF